MQIDSHRIALIVGVGAYTQQPSLMNPPKDARAVGAKLRELGFSTDVVVDPDRSGLERAIRSFGEKSKTADVALFYFAGHAIEAGGVNYLAPITTAIQTVRDLPFETVSMDLVTAQLEYRARAILLFLDACRDNPFLAKLEPAERGLISRGGLATPTATSSTMVIYATGPGKTAGDGNGEHSPFTTAFLHNVDIPNLEIHQLFAKIRREVESITNSTQIPWESSSLEDEFYFRPVALPGKLSTPDRMPMSPDPSIASIPAPPTSVPSPPAHAPLLPAFLPTPTTVHAPTIEGPRTRVGALSEAGAMLMKPPANTAAQGQGIWPDFQAGLRWQPTTSILKAQLDDKTAIEAPGPEVPLATARLSGIWSGWSCRDATASQKIAVEKLTSMTAIVSHGSASSLINRSWIDHVYAKVSDDQIQWTVAGTLFAVRLRADGLMDYIERKGDTFCSGVLNRVQTKRPVIASPNLATTVPSASPSIAVPAPDVDIPPALFTRPIPPARKTESVGPSHQ